MTVTVADEDWDDCELIEGTSFTDSDGYLHVYNAKGEKIATYAAGRWARAAIFPVEEDTNPSKQES